MIVYYDESILSYISSIRTYFGLSSSYESNTDLSNILNKKNPKKVFLILIDGMGANLINSKLKEDSFLRKNMMFKTSTVFPPTTTAATTSVLNGKAPCESAWLGWVQYFKEVKDFVIPFYGKSFYNKNEFGSDFAYNALPKDEIMSELNKKGIKATSVFPSFRDKDITSFRKFVHKISDLSKNSDNKFVYCYWDKYDSLMHRRGPSSKVCDLYLKWINCYLNWLSKNISDDTMMIVIADHGQVDVTKTINLRNTKYNKMLDKLPSLEPRATALYVKDKYKEEFGKEFKQEYEDDLMLLSKKEVLDLNIFGDKPNHERFEEFIGDYLAICKKGTVIYSGPKDGKFKQKGMHAGMEEDELMIPIIIYQK